MDAKIAALLFKVLSDETRLKIIEMLSCGEECACKLQEAFSITQPTLSYHMKMLVNSGLVSARKDGAWMRYTLNSELCRGLQNYLEQVSSDHENCVCKAVDQ